MKPHLKQERMVISFELSMSRLYHFIINQASKFFHHNQIFVIIKLAKFINHHDAQIFMSTIDKIVNKISSSLIGINIGNENNIFPVLCHGKKAWS